MYRNGAPAASGRVRNRQAQQFANQAAAQGAGAAAPTPSPEADLDHQIAAFEKLAKLKEQGIITPEEFDAKKKQILITCLLKLRKLPRNGQILREKKK